MKKRPFRCVDRRGEAESIHLQKYTNGDNRSTVPADELVDRSCGQGLTQVNTISVIRSTRVPAATDCLVTVQLRSPRPIRYRLSPDANRRLRSPSLCSCSSASAALRPTTSGMVTVSPGGLAGAVVVFGAVAVFGGSAGLVGPAGAAEDVAGVPLVGLTSPVPDMDSTRPDRQMTSSSTMLTMPAMIH